MSETLSFEETATMAADAVVQETAEGHPGYVDPEIDDSELFALVAQNANAIVKLNGAEMTLSEAMYQIPITRNNISAVISLVYELLARQGEVEPDVEEKPETESEEKAEKEKPAERKPQQPEKKAMQTEKKEPVPNVNKAENKAGQIIIEKPAATEPEVKTNHSATKKAGKSLKVEPAVVAQPTAAAERPAPETAAEYIPEPAPAIIMANENHSVQSPGGRQRSEAVKTVITAAEPTRINETRPAIDIPTLIARKAENDLPAEPESMPNTGAADQEPAATESEVSIQLDPVEETAGHTALPEDAAIPLFEDENDIPQLPDLDKEVDMAGYTEATDVLPVEEELVFEIPPPATLPNQLELDQGFFIPRLVYENSVAVEPKIIEAQNIVFEDTEEIESILVQLVQAIEAAEPEELKPADEILNNLNKLPAKVNITEEGAAVTEAETQEELEELFSKLLDEAGIEYTPVLIEQLASLVLRWNLIEEIKQSKSGSEPETAPQGIGTNEIIKQLIVNLNTAKKMAAQVWVIGKSAIWLYSHKLAA